jgi:hypothetical protein
LTGAASLAAVNIFRCICDTQKSAGPRIFYVSDEDNNLELLAEIVRRGHVVREDEQTPAAEKQVLAIEIMDLAQRIAAGEVTQDALENHELNWLAYRAQLRATLVSDIAKAVINFERDVSANGEPVELSVASTEVLSWWHLEHGREKLLSELPLADRQALERAEKE